MLPINVLVTVDTIAALSLGSLRDNIHLTDDCWGSANKGTPRLVTTCTPGQTIVWRALAVDVQSPALIAGVELCPDASGWELEDGIDPRPDRFVMPRWRTWALTVPFGSPPGPYPYRVALQMGAGRRSVMVAAGPSLDVTAA